MKPLRAASFAGIALAAVAGVRGASAGETKLVSATFNAVQDQMGFRWDLAPNGQINDGTNDCFDGGATLYIGGAQYTCNRPMMVPGSGEYVLEKTKGNLKVTRHVLVDKQRGAARYLEVIENTGSSKQDLQVSLKTRLGGSQTHFVASAGKPFAGQLGRSDAGLMALRSDQRPCVMFLVAGRGAKVRPTATVSNGNRTVTFTYSLSIPPKNKASILHFIAQRNAVTPKTVPSVFRTFYRGRPLKARVATELAGTIVNFGRVSGSAGGDAGPSVVSDLADSLGVGLGEKASLVMGEDAVLTGDVSCAGLTLESARGRAEITFDEVAGLAGGAGAGRTGRVYLRTGEVLAGRIDAPGLELETPRFRIALGPEQLNLLFTPISKADGMPPDGADVFLATRLGERLAVNGSGVVLDAATPWGTLRVPLDEVRSLVLAEEGPPLHKLALGPGSSLTVILTGDDVELECPRFGKVTVLPTEIASLARIARPEPELDPLPEDVRLKLGAVTPFEIKKGTRVSQVLDSLSKRTSLPVRLDMGSDGANTRAGKESAMGRFQMESEGQSALVVLRLLAQHKGFVASWRDGAIVLSRASDGDAKPGGPRLVLVGENFLSGEIDLPELTVATDAGATKVRTADILRLERAGEAGGPGITFSLELAGGDRLTGAVEEPILPVRVDLGDVLRVPVEHVISFEQPPPPPEEKEEGEEE
ncbi:MAG: hypothetical protein ACYS9X_07095 [Planctomycetota bacterium]|jgi:hypothetical protein